MDIIFDIDGTLADNSHRQHFLTESPPNWAAFNAGAAQDVPHMMIVMVLIALDKDNHTIILCTGRTQEYSAVTIEWLKTYDIPWSALYMRKTGDHRADYIVKEEILDIMLSEGFNPQLAFDDRKQVYEMWRRRGIPCCAVAEGNF